jgi:peptide deformylase
MILPVIKFGTPVLRQKGAKIEGITPEIKKLIADMFETMEENNGVGLAAQQIGVAKQLTVIDVREVKDRPSWAEIDGKPIDLADIMPLVLINPEVTPVGEPVKGSEGCLSFPEIYAEISRPESVDVRALDAKGKPIAFRCGGLLARAVQHETDHLNGLLFIDRMEKKIKLELQAELDDLQAQTKAELKKTKPGSAA